MVIMRRVMLCPEHLVATTVEFFEVIEDADQDFFCSNWHKNGILALLPSLTGLNPW